MDQNKTQQRRSEMKEKSAERVSRTVKINSERFS